MDSFEMNKIFGGVLLAVLVVLSLFLLSEMIFSPDKPEKSGYIIDIAAVDKPPSAKKTEEIRPVSPLLASASIASGEKLFKKCISCHTPNQGGPNRVGPNLWDIVGKGIARKPDYKYSKRLREYNEYGDVWNYENLNKFLKKPRKFARGTKMSFAGIKKNKERADVILYLRSLSADPKPLP